MSTLRVNGLKPRTGNTVTIVEGNTLSVTGIASVAGTMNVTGQANFASGANVTGVVTFANADLNSNLTVSSLTSNGTVEVGAGKSIKLNGASSGYTEIVAAAGSGSTTFVLPANGGSASQYLQTDGTGVLSWASVAAGWTWDTTGSALSSQSSVSITGIPATATQIIVAVRDMSTANDTNPILRAGTSSGLASSGYVGTGFYLGASNSNDSVSYTAGWRPWGGAAASFEWNGVYHLTKLTGNNWYCVGRLSIQTTFTNTFGVQGHVELGGTLDRVGILPETGTFDSGTVFVHYFSP